MKRSRELLPIRAAAADTREAAEARAEARIALAWPLIVGPALVRHTKLLRVRQRTLVLGCWTTEVISNLRLSAKATWPQVQARIKRLLGLDLRAMDIVPCDPPEQSSPRPPVADPLLAVLSKMRSRQNQDWTRERK